MVRLSIVMPAYNEEKNLIIVHTEITEIMKVNRWAFPYELIIVNDGSQDDTGKIADELAVNNPFTHALHHRENRGLGAALRTGFEACQGDYITWMSADGEIPLEHLLDLLRLVENADMVVSGRRLREGIVSWYREVLSFVLGLLSNFLLGFNWSQMSGIYLIRKSCLSQFPLKSNTGMINSEVYLHSIHNHYRIVEGPPLRARKRLNGQSKVANLPTIFFTFIDLVKLRLVLLTGK